MSKPVLTCRGLQKKFDDGKLQINVLRHIDLTVSPGERIAIVGASGSGKSTLLHLLGGLDTPTAGEVHLMSYNLAEQSAAQRGRLRNQYLGFIYQFHHLLPEFNVIENVAMPLLIKGLTSHQARESARDMLALVGLENRQTHKVGEISGGERQRVAIARALVTRPTCVLADEPTGNLDAATAEKIYKLMLLLNEKLKTAFIIVTHDMKLAGQMDKILILEAGQLVS